MKLTHTAFFGDGEYTFALTDDMITELERVADLGIGALYLRAVNMQFKLTDLVEIIRAWFDRRRHPPGEGRTAH